MPRRKRKMKAEETEETPKYVELPGGALRNSIKPGYHMIPFQGVRRIAERFSFGATRFGEENWTKSVYNRDDARTFAKEVFNHMTDHVFEMSNSEDPDTDHIGAIGWAVTVLAFVEDVHGCKWTEL